MKGGGAIFTSLYQDVHTPVHYRHLIIVNSFQENRQLFAPAMCFLTAACMKRNRLQLILFIFEFAAYQYLALKRVFILIQIAIILVQIILPAAFFFKGKHILFV